jgi:hypothetical protein
MKTSEALTLTPKELHTSLLATLLASIELNQHLQEPDRSTAIAATAHLISKEIHGQARELLHDKTYGENQH